MSGGVTIPSGSRAKDFSLEFIITFKLMFVVTAVAIDTHSVGIKLAIGIEIILGRRC